MGAGTSSMEGTSSIACRNAKIVLIVIFVIIFIICISQDAGRDNTDDTYNNDDDNTNADEREAI